MKDILKIIFVTMLLGFSSTLFAQTNNSESGYEEVEDGDDPFEGSWRDRLVAGGSIFPGYSNGWILEATPMIGYRVTNSTIAGIGANFSYRGFNDPWTGWSSSTSMYGGRLFVMQDLLYNVFAQAEYDYNYLIYKEKDPSDQVVTDQRFQSPGFLVGAGYTQRGNRIDYTLTVLYDVMNGRNAIPRANSIGGGLVFRGGFLFNL